METQSNNKQVRTDFVNAIPEHKLTKGQINKLSKEKVHHYLIKDKNKKIWDTKRCKYVESKKYDYTYRKSDFGLTESYISLIENVKGNIVLTEYRVRFRFNNVTMKPEYIYHQRVNVNVMFKDKPTMYIYSCYNGMSGLFGKLSEKNGRYHPYKLNWFKVHNKPFNLRQCIFKGTNWEYIDILKAIKSMDIQKILNFKNLSLLEKAQKENWLNIANQIHKGKSIPEQFGLPRFSKNEIWAMINFYKDSGEFNLNIYRDYIEMGYKLKKTFSPKRYLEPNYQKLHDRYVAEQRRIDMIQRKNQEAKRAAIQKWWKKNAKDIKAKDIVVNKIKSPKDLKEFGTFMANCMGVIEKNWKNDYAVKVKNEWVAVKWNKEQNSWQILGYKNLSLPKIIIPKIKRKVASYARA